MQLSQLELLQAVRHAWALKGASTQVQIPYTLAGDRHLCSGPVLRTKDKKIMQPCPKYCYSSQVCLTLRKPGVTIPTPYPKRHCSLSRPTCYLTPFPICVQFGQFYLSNSSYWLAEVLSHLTPMCLVCFHAFPTLDTSHLGVLLYKIPKDKQSLCQPTGDLFCLSPRQQLAFSPKIYFALNLHYG